jgi:hypothetical protein
MNLACWRCAVQVVPFGRQFQLSCFANGCSGNLRSDGAEGDELGRFCRRFLGNMTYRRCDLLKWKFNCGSGLEDVEVLTGPL